MKKTVRNIICFLMSLVLAFSVSSVAFATPRECDCGKAPIVFVGGIGTTLYSTDENGNEYTVFPIENDKMVSEILGFMPVALITGVFGGWDSLAEALDLMLNRLFADMYCDSKGNSVREIYVSEHDTVTVDEHLNGSNRFVFEYDWRLDPYVNSEKLEAYIDEVCEITGHDRVVLNAFSEGGEVTLAYLDAYGSDKIEKYIAECSAFQGLSMIGKLFTNQCSVTAGGVATFLETFIPSSGADDSVVKLVSILKYTGVYELAASLVSLILDNCFDTIYHGFARDSFASMPGVFNFVPAEYYDEAIEMVFGDEPKYAQLVERYDRYHNAQVNAENILKEAQEKGTAICLISNYGCSLMPLVGDDKSQSDLLIDGVFTSGGATFAPAGGTLGEGYVQAVNDGHNHLSPDGVIDASTGMFPDSTWYVYGFTHWNDHADLVEWLAEFDGQPTVFDSTEYPQFLVGNTATGAMTPQ